MPVLLIAAAGYGAAAGLLLPRAAYTLAVDHDEPWRTRCPRRHPLPGRLGPARCAACAGQPGARTRRPGGPGVRYGPDTLPFVLLTAAACALLAAATGARPELLVWLALVPPLVLLCWVDGEVRRLPDLLTLPLAAAAPVLLGLAALLPGAAGDWRTALLGGSALCGGYLVLFLLHPAGMAFGDVKLALPLGVALGWYGWPVLLIGAFAGLLSGALHGTSLLLRRRAGLDSTLAFGPHLVLGTLTGVVLGALAE